MQNFPFATLSDVIVLVVTRVPIDKGLRKLTILDVQMIEARKVNSRGHEPNLENHPTKKVVLHAKGGKRWPGIHLQRHRLPVT